MSTLRDSNWRSFLIILAATLILWIGSAMSDKQTVPVSFPIEYMGYDTARYVLVQYDSVVTLNVTCSGFSLFAHSFNWGQQQLRVMLRIPQAVKESHEAVAIRLSVAECVRDFAKQLGDNVSVTPVTENIVLSVAQLQSKAFVPELRNVDITFQQGYCLNGDPVIRPDSVYLYGSEASLGQVNHLFTSPATIGNVGDGEVAYALSLDTGWQRYRDLRVSTSEVNLLVPTTRCTEMTLSVPVRVTGNDSAFKVRLYPDVVQVNAWVPNDIYDQVTGTDFQAQVYVNTSNDTALRVVLNRFPAQVSIKEIKPEYVRYVLIK